MTIQCDKCCEEFSSKPSYNRHLRNKHPEKLQSTDLPFICYRCDQSFISTSAVERHFLQAHDLVLQSDTIQFSSEESFLEWKLRIESTQNPPCCSFVVYRGGRHASDGTLTRYFACSLSSLYGRKRSKEKQAKYYCPSRINMVKRTDGTVFATYVSTHIPHSHFNNPITMGYREELRRGIELLDSFVENTEDADTLCVLNDAIQKLISQLNISKGVSSMSAAKFSVSDLERVMEIEQNDDSAMDITPTHEQVEIRSTVHSESECELQDEISLEHFMNICGINGVIELYTKGKESRPLDENNCVGLNAMNEWKRPEVEFWNEQFFSNQVNFNPSTLTNRPATGTFVKKTSDITLPNTPNSTRILSTGPTEEQHENSVEFSSNEGLNPSSSSSSIKSTKNSFEQLPNSFIPFPAKPKTPIGGKYWTNPGSSNIK